MNSLKSFATSSARPLPVIVLADTSGSMSVDGKIEALNLALKEMLATFKEFDVVFLSVVRAGHNRLGVYEFGHLRLANRLNVAMSRQRKLLIAVGDRQMINSKQAQRQVPALYQFLRLCEGV